MLKQKRPTKSTRQLASPRAPHAPEEGTKSEQGGVCWRPGGACGTHTCSMKKFPIFQFIENLMTQILSVNVFKIKVNLTVKM